MPRLRDVNGKTRHLWGWRHDLPDHRDVPLRASFPGTQPRQIDLSPFCTHIEDQGEVGSCTANASTSAMEFVYRKLGKTAPELSRLFLYYATRVWVEHGSPREDSGAQIRDVMKALVSYGTCLESIWPYHPEKYSVEPSKEAEIDAKKHQILRYYRLPNLSTIKTCMALGWGCVGGFSVPASMMDEETTKTGIVKYPKPVEDFIGGHAVFFIGYNDTTRLLKFANSWGTGWGDEGFGYLPYDYVTNMLAMDFWSIQSEEL